MRADSFVSAKNDRQIAAFADDVRLSLDVFHDIMPDLKDILERRITKLIPDFKLVIVDDAAIQHEAFTSYNPPTITLRQSTYDGLEDGEPRARYTAAHELGHLFMHHSEDRPRSVVPMSTDRIPALYSAERQANLFAACFLMPERLMRLQDIKSATDVAQIFGVSNTASDKRLGELSMRPKRQLPESIKAQLEKMGVKY